MKFLYRTVDLLLLRLDFLMLFSIHANLLWYLLAFNFRYFHLYVVQLVIHPVDILVYGVDCLLFDFPYLSKYFGGLVDVLYYLPYSFKILKKNLVTVDPDIQLILL